MEDEHKKEEQVPQQAEQKDAADKISSWPPLTDTASEDEVKKPYNWPSYYDRSIAVECDDLRKLGYFAAIGQPELPFTRFETLLDQHRQVAEQLIAKTRENAEVQIRLCQNKITDQKANRTAIETEINEYQQETAASTTQKVQLETQLTAVKKKIYQFFLTIADKRKTILDKRIDETNASLQTLIQAQGNILNNDKLPFKGYQEKGQNLAAEIVKRYDELAKQITDRLQNVQKTIQRFDLQGLSPMVLNFMVSTGFLAALVAGWFFANFSQLSAGHSISNSGLLNNLINGCLQFVKDHSLRNCLFYLCGFLLIVTGLSWLSDWIKWLYRKWWIKRFEKLSKKEKSKTSFSLKAALSEIDGVPFSVEINAETWFIFWLEILPLFFITAVGVGLLIYGNLKGTPDNGGPPQLVSLTSEIAGFMMAVALGAVYYIYLSRKSVALFSKVDDGLQSPAFKKDWEFATVIAFIVAINIIVAGLVMWLHTDKIALTGPAQVNINLLQFMLYANVAGMCIGYGTFGKGLINNATWLEYKLDATHAKLNFFYQRSLSLFFTNEFGSTYKQLQEDMLTLLRHRLNPTWSRKKTAGQTTAQGQAEQGGNKKAAPPDDATMVTRNWFMHNFNKLVTRFRDKKANLLPETTPEDIMINWELNPEDRLLYPELADELESYNKERLDLEKQLALLVRKWNDFYEKSSFRYLKLSEMLRSVNRDIENEYRRIEEISDNLPMRLKLIRDEQMKQRVCLQDGFDMGIWYRENDVGPVPGYYERAKKMPPTNLLKTKP